MILVSSKKLSFFIISANLGKLPMSGLVNPIRGWRWASSFYIFGSFVFLYKGFGGLTFYGNATYLPFEMLYFFCYFVSFGFWTLYYFIFVGGLIFYEIAFLAYICFKILNFLALKETISSEFTYRYLFP